MTTERTFTVEEANAELGELRVRLARPPGARAPLLAGGGTVNPPRG